MNAEAQSLCILRMRAVESRVGLKRSTIYAMIARKEFPPQRALAGGRVGWYEHEIDAWVRSRPELRSVAGSAPESRAANVGANLGANPSATLTHR